MAGAGQRFVDAGYSIPKPLISIESKPMVVAAADCLPKGSQNIFVCRDEHISEAKIDKVLQKHYENVKIITVSELTEGQACTCLLAREHLENELPLSIGACDNAMTYDVDAFVDLFNQSDVDAVIWTFRHNPAVLQNPKMYGWVKTDRENFATEVSVKVPISDTPMEDHAIIGAFTFKRAKDFLTCADKMIEQNRRINNEFYVDMVMNLAIENGLKVKVFEVDRYICWGTPKDLETYEYWRGYFQSK
jgi:dTDP-glucose pyrophosphorylase